MGQRKDAGRKTSGRAQRCSRSVCSVVRSGLALICRPTIDTHVIHPHGTHFHCCPSSLVLFCQPVCMCKWSPTPCQEDPRLLVFVRSEQSLALLGRRTSSSVRRPSYVVYEEEYMFPMKPARGCISARRASTRRADSDVDGHSHDTLSWWMSAVHGGCKHPNREPHTLLPAALLSNEAAG
jgi:hypothetical protein